MAGPRVVIVDDHTLMTEALRRLLEPDCDVVGVYDDPRAFLRDVTRLRPDVAILDISMPTLNGLDAGRELRRVLPSARIIFLTMNEDADVAAEAFRVGASAYLLK
jgi:DNA-binding NarL/FixJ family response regulator